MSSPETTPIVAFWRSPLAADTALFSALTVVATWPQAVSLTSLPSHHDAWFNVWRLAWVAHAIATSPLRLFDANIFHPATGTLAYSDAVLLQSLAGAPFLWAGVSPVVVCNLLVLASFVFAGVACTALVRELTRDATAARLAGLIFAFAPFRFDHYFHLELLWTGWLPLIVRYGLRTATAWRPRDALLAAGCLLGQVLSCLYYGVIAGTFAVAAAAVAIVFGRGASLRRRLAIAALAAAVLAAPLALYARPYLAASKTVGSRSVSETRAYGATWSNYLASPLSNQLYGWTQARWGGNERQLFPGAVALLLAALGVTLARRRGGLLAFAALLVCLDLARGLDGFVFPALRAANPAIAGLRVPARFHAFSLLALAVLGGLGAAALRARRPLARSRMAAPIVALAMLTEYASAPLVLEPMRLPSSFVLDELASTPGAIVVHLPLPKLDALPGRDPYYALLSIRHWRPLINGYSGFYPPHYALALQRASSGSLTRSLDAVLALGATHIIVHPNQWRGRDIDALEDELLHDWRVSLGGRFDIGGEPVILARAAGKDPSPTR